MVHVALWEPEIPPNTGNVARLCAATDVPLHLIGRLGFNLDDRALRRAGLDYWPAVKVCRHADLQAFRAEAPKIGIERIVSFSAHAAAAYTAIEFRAGDALLFGSESRGLPPALLNAEAGLVAGIPMPSGKVRSLNLATAVGIVLFEALRQLRKW
jgi:tRNA (cytidine/uridine-2'-O-)-methyltransferase